LGRGRRLPRQRLGGGVLRQRHHRPKPHPSLLLTGSGWPRSPAELKTRGSPILKRHRRSSVVKSGTRKLPAARWAVAGVVLGLLGCSSQGPMTSAPAGAPAPKQASPPARLAPRKLGVRMAGELPAAVRDAAAVSSDQDRLVLLGGVNAAGASTSSIVEITNGSVSRRALLPA